MEKSKQKISREPKRMPDKDRWTYLTAEITGKINIPMVLAMRLNAQGKLSKSGKMYTSVIINDVLYDRTEDEQVIVELIALVGELSGCRKEISHHIEAASRVIKRMRSIERPQPPAIS